jgi:excisionase family DNA binding protein
MTDRHYFRPDEFADRFHISLSYVYLLIQRKELRAITIGSILRIPRSEYCRYCAGTNGCAECERRGSRSSL